jgi:hypothetical protein
MNSQWVESSYCVLKPALNIDITAVFKELVAFKVFLSLPVFGVII